MPQRSLAIFDFDGTVADSAQWFFDVLNEVARRHGFREVSSDEREKLRGCSNREILHDLQVPTWKLPSIARTMRRIATRDTHQIQLFPWVGRVFRELNGRGVAIAIVSSNSEENIRRVLGTDMASRVAYLAAGASLFGKAAMLKLAMKRCYSSRENSVAIGDEVRDIEAARSAGIACLAVTWGYAKVSTLEAARPTQLIRDPAELLDWFDQ